MKKDVVYILRQSELNNLELLFSLRSLKNIEYWKIYIVWYLPKWCQNVIHIPAVDPYNIKSLNALHKIKIACNDERISDDFILMNDDFYITKPTEIKYYHRGTIKQHIEDKKWRLWNSNYIQNLEKTFKLFPDWLDFSLHIPFIYNKQKFLELCENYDMKQGYLLRNLYANHYWIEWEYMEDCKVNNMQDLMKIKQEIPLLISSNDSFFQKSFILFLKQIFPEKSQYEKDWLKFIF